MKAIVIAVVAAVLLAGCQSTPKVNIQNDRFIVIEPPTALLKCPVAGPVPKFDTLTNKQVADYIDKLYKARNVCAINIQQIKAYIAKAKANVQ